MSITFNNITRINCSNNNRNKNQLVDYKAILFIGNGTKLPQPECSHRQQAHNTHRVQRKCCDKLGLNIEAKINEKVPTKLKRLTNFQFTIPATFSIGDVL